MKETWNESCMIPQSFDISRNLEGSSFDSSLILDSRNLEILSSYTRSTLTAWKRIRAAWKPFPGAILRAFLGFKNMETIRIYAGFNAGLACGPALYLACKLHAIGETRSWSGMSGVARHHAVVGMPPTVACVPYWATIVLNWTVRELFPNSKVISPLLQKERRHAAFHVCSKYQRPLEP